MSRLRLDRTTRARGAVVIEGPTDAVVLSRAYGLDERRFFRAGGRGNVIRCAEFAVAQRLGGVVCVADRDYEPAEEGYPECDMLVFYDHADLEAMLVNTDVLTRFVAEWASQKKLEAVGGSEGVRGVLYECMRPLAALRSMNERNGLRLRFDELPLHDVIEKQAVRLKMQAVVLRLAASGDCSVERLQAATEGDVPRCPHTNGLLVKGRDLLAALEVALRQRVGSLSKQQVKDRFAERSMRAMVGRDDLTGPFGERFLEALGRATS
jgi:hypothetical protein